MFLFWWGGKSRESPLISGGFNKRKREINQSKKKSSYFDQHAREWKADINIQSKLAKELPSPEVRMYKGILSVIDVRIALGHRGIALRGSWEKLKIGEWKFFLSLLKNQIR